MSGCKWLLWKWVPTLLADSFKFCSRVSDAFLWCCSLFWTRWLWFVSLWMKSWSVTIQMKPIGQYFPVVLFIIPYKVILTCDSVDEILKCDHSNESYWAVLSCGAVYYTEQGSSNLWVCGWNPELWPFKWKLVTQRFTVYVPDCMLQN